MSVAQALANGRSLALSPAILANLYRCLAEATIGKIDSHQNGPLWVFQLWLQVYFSILRPEVPTFQRTAALGLQLASRPAPPHRADEVFKHFLGLDVLSDDEFLVCRRQEYLSSLRLPTAAWAESEDAGIRQCWGSFVLARDLPLGCDARRASWEVYHPHFVARQLGYLQGCPVPLLASRSLLSRGRLTGSSERECKTSDQEFQEKCRKFRLRPTVPESLGTDTFGDWWEEYTSDFFGARAEDLVRKIFSDCPRSTSLTQPKESAQGGRGSRTVEVVAAVARTKKLVPKKRTLVTERTVPSKRPHREAEPAEEAHRPSKRVKKLAKKGDREIHVVPSDTTGTPAPAGTPSMPAVPASPIPIPPAVSLADPIVAPAPASKPVVAPEMGKSAAPAEAPSTPTVILEDVESESDEVPLQRRRRPVNSPPVHPSPVVEATARPCSPAADRGKRPMADPEATAETPIHPQDEDPPIPPQEVSSAFVSLVSFVLIFSFFFHVQPSWEVELDALLQSTTGEAGSSAAPAEPAGAVPEAEAEVFVKLHEVLSLNASQALRCKGLDSVGECLNDLASGGHLSTESISFLTDLLERTRQHFYIFERALQAEDDLKAAKVAQEADRAEIEAVKAKKAKLTEFDRQIFDLQHQISDLQRQRSAAAAELEKDFEANKARLTAFVAGARHVQQLQFNRKTRQAEIILGEAKWLELKAALETFLPSSP
ncbi:proline-rich protein 12-like [Pyrus ussuriensis x Pyrus communis]|uniref:Proline-rich protein 12-like n=1 Tax=Pyrus ussuriensis x Pyrus communis TaxID=2448454 RepID=A0A5N5HJ94_9ROSA|nr:proline-rich protein 12-like [Pyrus ussuriensis x Pyrus communis]